MKYETKIYSLIVKPEDEPIFSEQATIVGIDDEAAGVFFTIEQNSGKTGFNGVSFDHAEWLLIVEAVERLRGEWA